MKKKLSFSVETIIAASVLVAWSFSAALSSSSLIPEESVSPSTLVVKADRQLTHSPASFVETGFSSAYVAESGRWTWSYSRLMSNGCQMLLLSDNPVTISDPEVQLITVDLKTYMVDDACPEPPVIKTLQGRILANENTEFTVKVDGKVVYP